MILPIRNRFISVSIIDQQEDTFINLSNKKFSIDTMKNHGKQKIF